MIADEGDPRHIRIVLEILHLLVSVAELAFDRALTGQQAQVRAVEPRAQQIVDGVQKRFAIVEDANRLANGLRLTWSGHDRSPSFVC
jgi:hypothetical protein